MQINFKEYLNKVVDFSKRFYYLIVPTVILFVFAIFLIIGFNQSSNIKESDHQLKTNNSEIVKKEKKKAVSNSEEENDKTLKSEVVNYKVDIKGAVNKPGVYEAIEGSRVIDIINISGGLKENANTHYINLSKKVTDEMVIIIYTNEEIENLKNRNTEEIDTNIYICPDNINDACIASKEKINNDQKNDDKGGKDENKSLEKASININSATKEQLMTLPGVGETKADAIIAYREENGGFKELEDLTNVSGIGTSTFEKFKEYITI